MTATAIQTVPAVFLTDNSGQVLTYINARVLGIHDGYVVIHQLLNGSFERGGQFNVISISLADVTNMSAEDVYADEDQDGWTYDNSHLFYTLDSADALNEDGSIKTD